MKSWNKQTNKINKHVFWELLVSLSANHCPGSAVWNLCPITSIALPLRSNFIVVSGKHYIIHFLLVCILFIFSTPGLQFIHVFQGSYKLMKEDRKENRCNRVKINTTWVLSAFVFSPMTKEYSGFNASFLVSSSEYFFPTSEESVQKWLFWASVIKKQENRAEGRG